MKALGLILLALIVGFVGYQFAYPKLDDWAQFPKYVEKPAVDPNYVAKKEEPPKPKKEEPKVAETPMPEPPKPEPKPEEPKPAVAMTPDLGKEAKKEPKPDEFTPPDFPPIEQVVKNWGEIPKKAFPREVKLRREVEFVVNVNGNKLGTKVGAGGKVHVIDQDGDMVTVAPTPVSPARVKVAMADTDLKETLTDAYEKWKPAMVEYLRKQWDYKHNHKQEVVAATSKGPQRGDKPERSPDGTYPLLLASMKAGQVTEITPTNIKKWGDALLVKIDGKEYWTVNVNYTTKTMFGDFDTEAQARIFSGKVEKWVYTGSGEVVP